jgi:acetyl esterase/lipase
MRKVTRFFPTLLAILLIAGCSGSPTTHEVTTTVVSHETTQDIWVFAPDSEGPWPIVFTYHGQGGTGDGLATTARNLASHGMLVFSPSYRSTEAQHIEQDLECAYRYGLSIAEDLGGDLNQPITAFGHSFGGQMALLGGLSEADYGPGGTYDGCFDGAPRPDVIVSVTACYYENPEGGRYPFDTAGFSNTDAKVVLFGGSDDEVCNIWQSQDASDALQAAGYDTALIEVNGGNHANVVFYEVIDGEWIDRPDDPVGHEVIQQTIDAIDAAQ